MTEGFKSKEIILQAQKKFLGKVTNKNVIKLFIHDRNANILDNVYRLAKVYTGNKKESEKLTKNIIKIIVKLSILYRNDQFDSNELELANNFKDKFRELTMIACREILKELIKRHLTDKTLSRVDKIFDFFSNSVFLDSVFINPAISDLTEIVHILINDLKELLDKDL
ncbi:PREDICTED: tumor necrosis factor alpha-induced protein 8-like protein isoform X2 [Diuraphis noxia]|uniref:tumor necrosis factor alpha-induced protein 8-like protein isoform X2 n=1 Tax=Diuraphis noxia TaxID=143948 RepID=UPI0007637001|nr:PREDICTED: tumor necrosis factor alpha-induced protein 8-like protein isoform X2 [Diuraphis noxia]